MQEERKSCCRIKHLNPFKSIFLLWIGTFAARGMQVRVGTIGSNFLPSRKLPFISRKSLFCKNGNKFCSIAIQGLRRLSVQSKSALRLADPVISFQSLKTRPLKHLTFRHKYLYEKKKIRLQKRLDPILQSQHDVWMDESYSYRTQDQTTDSGLVRGQTNEAACHKSTIWLKRVLLHLFLSGRDFSDGISRTSACPALWSIHFSSDNFLPPNAPRNEKLYFQLESHQHLEDSKKETIELQF